MSYLNIDSCHIHINYILQNIEKWKREFNLVKKYEVHNNPLTNNNSIVSWSYKNSKKIEFIIKNNSYKLKRAIVQELEKSDYSAKFVPITKDEYIIIVKMKNSCTIY